MGEIQVMHLFDQLPSSIVFLVGKQYIYRLKSSDLIIWVRYYHMNSDRRDSHIRCIIAILK